MQTIRYWEACDIEEGFHKCFASNSEAKKAAKGNGFYGADASVIERKLVIYDSYDEWRDEVQTTKERQEFIQRLQSMSDAEFHKLKSVIRGM